MIRKGRPSIEIPRRTLEAVARGTLPAAEVAARYGCSVATVRRACKSVEIAKSAPEYAKTLAKREPHRRKR